MGPVGPLMICLIKTWAVPQRLHQGSWKGQARTGVTGAGHRHSGLGVEFESKGPGVVPVTVVSTNHAANGRASLAALGIAWWQEYPTLYASIWWPPVQQVATWRSTTRSWSTFPLLHARTSHHHKHVWCSCSIYGHGWVYS